MKINILDISEVRWQGAGKITLRMFEIFYSIGTEYERGVAITLDQDMAETVKRYWTL